MRAAIEQALIDLERQEDVRVCLAVESGSRAWGFASLDSDYDVRFIYVHRLEKYLYVLRRLLALRWIEQGRGQVPMEFVRLIDATVTEADVRNAINELVAAKIAGRELDRGPRIGVLSDFIEGEMKRAESTVAAATPPHVDAEDDLNSVFRSILSETWERTA